MKKLLFFAMMMLTMGAQAQEERKCKMKSDDCKMEQKDCCIAQKDCCRQTPARKLLDRLQELAKKGVMYGHQDAPFYGLTWEWEDGRCDVKETCGDFPAVMGFELGGIEMADAKNLDSVPFTRMREEIIAHHERGGIVTISWHPRNPLTTIMGGGPAGQKFPEGTAWDVSSNQVVKSILPGGEKHDKFVIWMQRVANFLASLKTPGGEPVPIIFRPWHEHTGSWFWWGEKLCTAKQYVALWNMLQDYLCRQHFTNLVWAYSPGMAADLTEAKYLERYPGHDRIDLLGFDGYQWGSKEDFMAQFDQNLKMLTAFAKKNNKVCAVTECGLKNLADPTWWTSTLLPIVEKYDGVSYLLTWRNYKKEWFGPSPEQPDAKYFKDFYKSPKTLFLNEIK